MFSDNFPLPHLTTLTLFKIIYMIRKSVHAIRDLSALHQEEGEYFALAQRYENGC